MTPAPFTPDTVARIRELSVSKSAGQIAAELRWDAGRVLRVAKQFAIEVTGSATESVLPSPPKPAVPLLDASIRPKRVLRGTKPKKPHIEFCSTATLAQIVAAFDGNKRIVMQMLIDAGPDGTLVSGATIGERLSVSPSYVTEIMNYLRRKLMPTQWWIESIKGRTGGHRLVTQSGRMD